MIEIFIEPNEEIKLSFFIPAEVLTEEMKDLIPRLHVKGYIGEVKDDNRFEIVGLEVKDYNRFRIVGLELKK